MLKVVVLALALISASAVAEEPDNAIRVQLPSVRAIVDLRDSAAMANLKATNPAHFEKIQKILAGLAEEPQRAEGDWLQAQFNASDVDLSRHLLKTSNPPKQLLQFTLDDVRYRMHLTRRDLAAEFVPVR